MNLNNKNRQFTSSGKEARRFVTLATTAVPLALAAMLMSAPVSASPLGAGWISTDRLGYNGSITRYSDADLTNQVGDVLQTGPRDLSLYNVANTGDLGIANAAIVMGSWWYTTSTAGAGWGNTTGNTGPGFMQYYSSPTALDQVVSSSYSFGSFDGTYWTDFSFQMEVLNGSDFARLSAPANVGDSGIFRSLYVGLTVSGLQGEQDGDWISASNQPTAVTGFIRGVFENTSTSSTQNNGFYGFEFTLSMQNWAWDNRESLQGQYLFADSSFGARVSTVPVPGGLALLGIGLFGIGVMRRRRFR